jgi:hypothetical protein
MHKNPNSQSGIFTPRVLVAFALCSFGVLLGMFSLAATPLSGLASSAEPTARRESSPSRKPVETTRAHTSVPPDPINFLSISGSNANRLPPGVPLPLSELESSPSRKPSGLDAPPGRKPGAQFTVNEQGESSSSSPAAGFPGFAGMPSGLDAPPASARRATAQRGRKPLRPRMASGANSLENPGFANQQAAPLSVQQPAASESMPLASTQGDWSIVSSPSARNASQTFNFPSGVTCVSASDCWAVGFSWAGSNSHQTLIERWDGTAWAIVSSPNTSPTRENVLFGVTCVSASNCWAVGDYYNAPGVLITPSTLTLRYAPSPPIPTSAVSRKIHGTAGTFDIDLPLAGNPGIECRSGGTNNDYQMLMTFANAVSFNGAAVTSGTGTVSSTSGSGTTALTVNLTGVTNAQTITLTLASVNDGTKTGYVGVRMGVLLGDTTGNGSVNSSDVSQTKAQSGTAANATNFRTDVTVNGLINSSDVSTVKSKSGTALP